MWNLDKHKTIIYVYIIKMKFVYLKTSLMSPFVWTSSQIWINMFALITLQYDSQIRISSILRKNFKEVNRLWWYFHSIISVLPFVEYKWTSMYVPLLHTAASSVSASPASEVEASTGSSGVPGNSSSSSTAFSSSISGFLTFFDFLWLFLSLFTSRFFDL